MIRKASEVKMSIWLPRELYERLKADAEANERTLAAQIRYICGRWYAEQDAEREGGGEDER